MKIQIKYQILLLFTVTLLAGGNIYSQSFVQEDASQEVQEAAKEKTTMWINELSLTGKQAALMEKKIIEFAIKKEKLIQSKMREEAKTEKLQALQELEYKDMRDILTQPQFNRYLALKKQEVKAQQGNK
ncbi:hypothetical protein [Salinimicrobium sp. GXAS 041]|uniref:hypothetical protein n=1 Tax=Salinimicrobium sp. GXAS 041 TaxID=3400806 RepID=UPI003C76D5C5